MWHPSALSADIVEYATMSGWGCKLKALALVVPYAAMVVVRCLTMASDAPGAVTYAA
jgi:hypothetical protein